MVMDKYNFSTGHIFMRNIDNMTDWSISINGAGSFGKSISRNQAIADILNHWKISGKIKDEITGIFDNKVPVVSGKIGNQLELF